MFTKGKADCQTLVYHLQNKWKAKLSVFALLMVSMSNVYSAQCSQVFPGGLNVTSTSGNVIFNKCMYVQNNPSTQLVTPSIITNASNCSPPTCYTATCTASGGTAALLTLPTFPTISGSNVTVNPNTSRTIGGSGNATTNYGNVTLSGTSTLNFSAKSGGGTVYRINTLTLNNGNNVINFQPGDYWIQNFNVNGNSTFNVVGTTGTVRLYFQSFSPSGNQNWNSITSPVNSNPTAKQLLIISYGHINFNNVANVKGLIYANGPVILNNQGTITGAITAQSITLNGAPNVQYDSSAVSSLNFGSGLCTSGSSSADRFTVTGLSSPSSNCSTLNVTVTARRADNSVDTSYTGTVVLSTQGSCVVGTNCTGVCTSGGSSCKGTWNTSGGCTGCGNTNGYAEYTFKTTDNGVRAFTLVYPPEGLTPTNIVAYQKTDSKINGSAGAITFNPSQFIVVPSNTTVGAPPAPAGYSTAQVAGNNFNPQVKVVAYSGCGSGVATNYTGNKSIRLYSTYVNPTPANAAGAAVMVNGSAIAKNSTATATSQTLNFVNGAATLSTVKYSDVGSLSLTVLDNSIPTMTGTSGNIVVKPFDFMISGTNIPGTSSATGTIFGKAGQPFSATVTVKASDGATAGSFGRETTPEGIRLQSASVAAPAGGRNGSDNLGTIGNAASFTRTGPGVFQGTTFTYDEVGSINLQGRLSSGNYLGAGDVLNTTTVLVGRFQPNHFAVTGNTPVFATGCSSGQFTYLDQPFVYSTAPVLTVTAKAANNPISTNYTTQNYNGSFKKISPNQFAASVQDYQSGAAGTPAIDKTAANLPLPTETDNGAGTLTYTFAASGGGANEGLKLNRPAASATPSAPFTANIELRLTVADTDTPPVTYSSSSGNAYVFNGSGSGIAFSTSASFYHGRLVLQNAYGSELTSLDVPMELQYYNGSQFVKNSVDGCTSISNPAYVLLTDPPSPQTGVSTTASFPQANFISGVSFIRLSAPTPSISGQKNIELNLSSSGANLPWLQSDWPFLPGSAYENPRAQANFGAYKGEPNIIYQRETYP